MIDGQWQASYRTPDGFEHASTLSLQTSGDTLTGKLSSARGSVAISEGKIIGNQIMFTVVRRGNGDEITVNFSGRVTGGTMKLKMQYGGHNPIEWTARRVP